MYVIIFTLVAITTENYPAQNKYLYLLSLVRRHHHRRRCCRRRFLLAYSRYCPTIPEPVLSAQENIK